MRLEGEGLRMRIFLGESDRRGSMPLDEAIVQRAQGVVDRSKRTGETPS